MFFEKMEYSSSEGAWSSKRKKCSNKGVNFFKQDSDIYKYKLYKENAEIIDNIANELEKTWYSGLKDELINFSENKSKDYIQDFMIPIGFFEIGFGLDTDFLLNELETGVKLNVSPIVVRILNSRSYSVKDMFQKIYENLKISFSSQDNEDINKNKSHFVGTRVLDSIYNSQFKNDEIKKPIVIIIDNAHTIGPSVFQEFLDILSNLHAPLILLVGISSKISIDKLIPRQKGEREFSYQYFKLKTASANRLNIFIEKILNQNKTPILLSGSLIKYFCSYYDMQDSSIADIVNLIKVCLFDHFMKKSVYDSNVTKDVAVFDQSNTIRKYSIFVDYSAYKENEKQDNSKSPKKGSKKGTISKIEDEVNENVSKLMDWMGILRFLFDLSESLYDSQNVGITGRSQNPLGETLKEAYILCFSGGLFKRKEDGQNSESSPFEKIQSRIKEINKDSLIKYLEKSEEILQEYVSDKVHFLNASRLTPFLKKINEFISAFKEVNDSNNTEGAKNKGKTRNMSSVKWREEYQNKLFTKNGVLYTQKNREFLSFLSEEIRLILTTKDVTDANKFKNNEIFVVDNLSYLLKAKFGDLEGNIEKSLTLPNHFLKCNCCSGNETGSLLDTLPDTSILYKLIKEQTCSIVNMNHIYTSFKASLEEGNAKRRRLSDDACLLKYYHALKQLEFIGIINTKGRVKKDEFEKTFWI